MIEHGTRAGADIETRSQAEAVVERMYLAVNGLCIGTGDVRDRLVQAAITLMPLGVNAFPQYLQADYLWVMKELTKYPSEHPNIYGPVEATMKRIKNSTGKKIAARIFRHVR